MDPVRGAGQAIGWRAAQLGGVQIISLLRLMILARILAPDAFGLVAVAAVTIGLLLGLSNFGMVQALVQRPSPTEEEYDIAWTVGLMRAALVTSVLVAIGPALAGLFGAPEAGPIVRVMALRPLIDAMMSIGVARLTRQLAFRRLAVMALPASMTDAVTAIVLAPVLGVWALVAGTLTGATLQAMLSYVVAPHRPRLRFTHRGAEPLVRYGQWILYTGIVSLAGTALTQMGISRLLGASALGKYFVASKLAFMPGEAAVAVIAAVAFPLYASHRENVHRSARAFSALFTGQVVLLFPIFAIIIALAPVLETALGARWTGTAPTVQILTAACMVGLFGDSITPLLRGRGRADRAFFIEVTQTGVRLALLFPLISALGVPGAALAWFAGNAVAQVIGALSIRDVLRHGIDALARERLLAGAAAAAVGAGVAVAAGSLLQGFTALMLAGGAATLGAASTLWLLDRHRGLRLSELLPWHPAWGSVRAGLSGAEVVDVR
jgi:lipopolysaccharide exporter